MRPATRIMLGVVSCSLWLCACLSAAPAWAAGGFNVRDRGAKGDGKTRDTAAIQAAIDDAARQGGGIVFFPPGNYLSGTLRLKSGITLELSAGAVLTASPDQADFDTYEELPFKPVDDRETTYFRYALIAAENAQHVGVRGPGIIDGNRSKRGGPKTIAIKNSSQVSIRNVTIRNSPNYAVSLLGCEDVDIDGVSVLNGFSDGIDPDCSRFVRIANCYIDTWDDAICLKSSQALGKPRATEHVTVSNCVLRTNCNHFKMGTESRGGFKNIAVSNCTMLRRDAGRPPISGIALESVDGAEIDSVTISNINMREARVPIFIRLGNRGRGLERPPPGTLRDVSISNVVALAASLASSITGLAGRPVERVSLTDINLQMNGGGQFKSLEVPEAPEKYPEATMFGELPAHSLYARHVHGLVLRNVRARLAGEDRRPAVVLDDVAGLDLNGFQFDPGAGGMPVLWFHQVTGALLTGGQLSREVPLFVRVSGPKSGGISVMGNDLRLARKLVDVTAAAEHSSVTLSGNITAGKAPAID